MTRYRYSRRSARLPILIAAAFTGFAAMPVNAETGSAAAKDQTIHIDLLGLAQLDVLPQAPVGFDNATEPTSQENSVPSTDIGTPLIHVSTGAIASQAQYAPGTSFSAAGAEVTVLDFNLSVVDLIGTSVLSITADLIRSSSSMFGYCLNAGQQRTATLDDITFFNGFDVGNLSPGPGGDPGDNGTELEGIAITILGTPVPDIPLNPPPNTTIDLAQLGLAGATLVLNEQTMGGDGVTMSSQTSNAMHLTLNSTGGLITADVAIANSSAKLDCTQ